MYSEYSSYQHTRIYLGKNTDLVARVLVSGTSRYAVLMWEITIYPTTAGYISLL